VVEVSYPLVVRRWWVCRARRSLVVVIVFAGALLGSVAGPATHAGAQQSLIDSDPGVVKARADLAAAQGAAHTAAAQLEQTTEARAAVDAKIADDQTRIDSAEQQRAGFAAQRDAVLAQLRARLVVLYETGSDTSGLSSVLSGNALDAARRQHLGDAATSIDHALVKKLESTRSALADLEGSLRHDQADLHTQQATLDSLVSQLDAHRTALDQSVAAANAALAQAQAIGALRAAGQPIMGPATLTADQMVAWYDTQGYHAQLADATVAELAQIYLQEGTDEGVRGDFAFAQAIVETGGFSAAAGDNYSGMGWCDSCVRGTVFPTPRDGIRAQIQLLLNYADASSRAANLHHPPSPYWWDPDPAVAAHDFDTYFAKGWAPTWSDMGHGNWATDPNYASKVIAVYQRMVAFAQSH
jgi:hypothetical protein